MLPEEATEAGLVGATSFLRTRDLSRPFSGGEWAGLTRGVAGSCRVNADRRSQSKQSGGKRTPPGMNVEVKQTRAACANTDKHTPACSYSPPLTHTHTHRSPVTPSSLCFLCLTFRMNGEGAAARKVSRRQHTRNKRAPTAGAPPPPLP